VRDDDDDDGWLDLVSRGRGMMMMTMCIMEMLDWRYGASLHGGKASVTEIPLWMG